jgi:hypothetical protein
MTMGADLLQFACSSQFRMADNTEEEEVEYEEVIEEVEEVDEPGHAQEQDLDDDDRPLPTFIAMDSSSATV